MLGDVQLGSKAGSYFWVTEHFCFTYKVKPQFLNGDSIIYLTDCAPQYSMRDPTENIFLGPSTIIINSTVKKVMLSIQDKVRMYSEGSLGCVTTKVC